MSPEGRSVGLLEDDPIMGESLVQRLTLEGIDVSWWRNGEVAIEELSRRGRPLDLMICDIRLPGMSGEDVFRRARDIPGSPPFLFITGFAEIDQAVRLMRDGGADYITKPFAMDEFLARMLGSMRSQMTGDQSSELGDSDAMRTVGSVIRRFADHDLPVLIWGETGVGKEVAARHLHSISQRREKPFVAVNCTAIPNDLLESELFGHEKGAFTGAATRHLGFAERAGAGTLFLDEIGDMPLHMQGKLLRLVEDGFFFRVGGERPVPFNARILSASHQNLEQSVERGRFRQDLFFRLNALQLKIPPLRERPEDIKWLLDRFFSALDTVRTANIRGISAMAEEAALDYAWPGNVRELKNRLERAVVLTQGEWITAGDLFPESVESQPLAAESFVPLGLVRDAAERRQILRALAVAGRLTDAAKLLGISRTTLWEKMRRLGLSAKESSES